MAEPCKEKEGQSHASYGRPASNNVPMDCPLSARLDPRLHGDDVGGVAMPNTSLLSVGKQETSNTAHARIGMEQADQVSPTKPEIF